MRNASEAGPETGGSPAEPRDRAAGVPESVPLESWEGCTAAELRKAWGVTRIHLFERVGSTNDVARILAENGAPDATVVLAEEQSAGRGRVGRIWASAPGLGLWLSYVSRPASPTASGPLPLRVALAVARALDPWADGNAISIKWPNDLLLDGRKVGGILCEGAWEGERLRSVVVGIGLNLLHGPADLPGDLRANATSLRAATGQPIARFEVAGAVVKHLRETLQDTGGSLAHEPDLAARDALLGRRVRVFESEHGAPLLTGRAAGIGADGALRVDTRDGRQEVRTGTVRLADSDP
ncbi:MAG: biotin--[acetyl-CoA-carboxylase] ligase [Gemmatimonadota bacterium]